MIKEFGGYIPLEINKNREYYSGEDVLRFNCARSAIDYILDTKQYKKIYIPFYLCESVQERIKCHEIEIERYHIDDDLRPVLDNISNYSIILITNYFGIRHNDKLYVDKYKDVIFDNTQAFFEPPVKGAFNIYSARKFFGVTDGAYLITNQYDFSKENILCCYEPKYASYLLDAITYGTNEAYRESLLNEEQIATDGMCGMSSLSKRILSGINYEIIKNIRIENYKYMNEMIGKYNEFGAEVAKESVPMIYPLLIKDDSVRNKLIQNKIYVAQWWKYLCKENLINQTERSLSEYLLPIPIDQRYDKDEIEEMAITISKIVGNL